MPKNIVEEQVFRGLTFSPDALPEGEYFQCKFEQCNFAKADLSEYHFEQCTFVHCDLSMIHTRRTAFQDIRFEHCKMLGIRFEDCSPFLLTFSCTHCQLDFSSFAHQKLKGTHFKHCKMWEVDCVETDFSKAHFEDCDLKGAIFDRTNLAGANLVTAVNFQLDPDQNTIKKARFSRHNIIGLLGKWGIEVE